MGASKEAVESVAQITGLKVSTLQDLLDRGWTYLDDIGRPRVFIEPVHTRKEGNYGGV